MYILGLTSLGDSAASIVRDGELVAAVEEERFSRKKHHSGFPYNAVQFCLDEAGISIRDVDHVSLYWKPWVLRHKALQAAKSLTKSRAMFEARVDRGVTQVSESYLGMLKIPQLIRDTYGPSAFKFHYLDHHECHAASCFFVSPFKSAAILTMDGTGEDTTTMFSTGRGARIRPFKRIKLPHSLGQFYSAVTNFIGFDMFTGDEWKVMGLAAYGEPKYYDFFANHVLKKDGDMGFEVDISVLDHHLAKHYQFSEQIIEALGPPRDPKSKDVTKRDQDVAASAQKVLEDRVLDMIRGLHAETGEENLCLAGGVAFNSVMNGRIMHETPFKRFFVQPAAGDAGCSLGAAFLTYHHVLKRARKFEMKHAYWGPGFSNDECKAELDKANVKYHTLPDEELLPRVAQMIADGAIIGWFNGRMEFGPRALGARSFVADPRRADMRELLNKKVKLREWFRPLAPSMHEEVGQEVFGVEHHDPFMITVIDVAEEYRAKIPAVVHVDDSARPQMVSKETNPRYWQLIEEFRKITGVPVLLNTSFNIQEPIVCKPENAIKTFMGANFDAIVLQNHLVLRADNGGFREDDDDDDEPRV